MQYMQYMQSQNKKATVPRSFASGFLQKISRRNILLYI